MLRRIPTLFALLLFALAFSILGVDRPTMPPNVSVAQGESPGFRIAVALFLPHVAHAQAVASAPGQTVADAGSTPAAPYQSPEASAKVADSGAGVADKAGASRTILWGTLALIAAVILVVWLLNRRSSKPYVYEPQGGSGSPSDNRHRT